MLAYRPRAFSLHPLLAEDYTAITDGALVKGRERFEGFHRGAWTSFAKGESLLRQIVERQEPAKET